MNGNSQSRLTNWMLYRCVPDSFPVETYGFKFTYNGKTYGCWGFINKDNTARDAKKVCKQQAQETAEAVGSPPLKRGDYSIHHKVAMTQEEFDPLELKC